MMFYLIKWCDNNPPEWIDSNDLPIEMLLPYYGATIICIMNIKKNNRNEI